MGSTIPGADTQTSVSIGQQSSLLPLKSQNSIAATSALAPVDAASANNGNPITQNPVTGKAGVTGLDQQNAANLGQRPLTPLAPNLPASSLQSVLTRGGMLIQALFAEYGNASAGPVPGQNPLLDPAQLKAAAETAAPGSNSVFAGSGQLAGNLASEVEHSGLFYESHLQQFLSGTRSINDIMREPQVRLGLPGMAPGTAGDEQNMPPGMDARVLLLARLTTLQMSPSPAPGPTADAAVALLKAVQAGLPLTPEAAAAQAAAKAAGAQPALQTATQAATQDLPQAAKSPSDIPANRAFRASDLEQAYGIGPKLAIPAGFGVGSAQRAHADLLAANNGKLDDGLPLSEDHTSARLSQSAIHPAAEATVRQQLELLASDTWRWRGELAAGQQMEWEIRRRQPEQDQQSQGEQQGRGQERIAPVAQTWQTRVSLHLPFLGKVDFQIDLGAGQLHAQVQAPSAETLDMLEENASPLRERLSAHSQGQSSLNISLMSYQ